MARPALLAPGGFPARAVVWEWLNEHGRWRPYSAAVCHHLEKALQEDARGRVPLGPADGQLAPYVIDLQAMHQLRQDTGTVRPVRRNFYDPSSAPGRGIVWEWENDGSSWTPYDMELCITIQNAYEKQHPWLDLSSLGFAYLISFSSMAQTNRDGMWDGSLQCPTCKAIYGEKTGTQPPGKMEFHLIPHSLPGHSDSKTIRIIYDIPTGIQGPEHPNPGKRFTARGFPRHCYLPDTEKGRKVLKLLLVAWERRLIFTVGTSSTTGESDTVVWNEIHHKTEFGSNLTGHGYPDPNYLDNVLAELRAQGVSEANIKD
ncbi:PREDICTED: E3 ubiquitin-protein ligase DTX1-like [Tinamus guttatus]|uniref:E3 ubiquitin-protein ligase DTX1-like n=1 Tax=Tinamus guttatus TaxID=94827 RepID=UPI00052F0F62|nr:PREDICTED: E3 ubiquitin-protein ligase DTX1-like [Tinamus guttatus]